MIYVSFGKGKVAPWPKALREVGVKKPTHAGDGVTGMGHHYSSSPPSSSTALKRARYLFTAV